MIIFPSDWTIYTPCKWKSKVKLRVFNQAFNCVRKHVSYEWPVRESFRFAEVAQYEANEV